MFFMYKMYFSILQEGLGDGLPISALFENNVMGMSQCEFTLPYVIITDDVYSLNENLMQPYSLTPAEKNFNK